MMNTEKIVREIALEQPHSIRVFEHFGIDYCCGGRKTLAEACTARNLSVLEVLSALKSAADSPSPQTIDWAQAPLRNLIDHIVAKHHAYVKAELPRLANLAQKVVNRHGDTQPHLPALQKAIALLDDELTHHLAKEESVLFPYIAALEDAMASGCALPDACFGTVANPIAMMTREHDAAGGILAEIDRFTDHFNPPVGACPTYHAFYNALREFELDLHQHIHLENNILFPHAIEMEQSAVSVTT